MHRLVSAAAPQLDPVIR